MCLKIKGLAHFWSKQLHSTILPDESAMAPSILGRGIPRKETLSYVLPESIHLSFNRSAGAAPLCLSDSASLCSLASRYDNPIPTLFLAPLDCSKIPAQRKLINLLKSCGTFLKIAQKKKYTSLKCVLASAAMPPPHQVIKSIVPIWAHDVRMYNIHTVHKTCCGGDKLMPYFESQVVRARALALETAA